MWNLLRVNPASQNRYLAYLNEHHPTIETYVPHHIVLRRPHGIRKPIPTSQPCYPGYIFANPDPDSADLYYLTRTPIRAYFVRFGAQIESIPEAVITELKRLESLKQLIPEPKPAWTPGQRVHISSPAMDIQAILVRLITSDKMLVDTPFCQMVVSTSTIKFT
jgi:transcriptional antiterminator RfaH